MLAALIDIYKKIIPNWLTYPALFSGLLLGILPESGPTISQSLMGLAVAFFPALLLFLLNSLGGGDVKLLSAVGAWVGYPMIVDVLFYSIVAGTGIGLALIIWKGQFWLLIKDLFLQIFSKNNIAALSVNEIRIPFAAAIAFGATWALFLPGVY